MGKGVQDPNVDAGGVRGGPPAGKARRPSAWPWPLLAALLVLAVTCFLLVFLVIRSAVVPATATPSPTATQVPAIVLTTTRTPFETPAAVRTPTATSALATATSAAFTPVATPGTPTPPPTVQVETSEGTDITDVSTLGEVSIEYPIRMTAGSSDVVVLSVYVPAMLASLVPVEVERVEIPPDAPAVAGELNRYRATILVAGTMRIELQSLGFEIEDIYPATQLIDIDEVNKATVWAWTVQAPERAGTYVLVVRAYRVSEGDETRPSWIRSLAVEVTRPPETRGVPGLGWILGALVLGNALVAVALILVFRRRRRLLPVRRPPYDLDVLRELLLAAFGPDELRRVCQGHPDLRGVLNDLDANPSLNEVVDAVVNHVERYDLFEVLLEVVRQHNPRQYARFEPRLRTRP